MHIKIYSSLLLAILTSGFYAQLNPLTNSFDNNAAVLEPINIEPASLGRTTAGWDCQSNLFYVIDGLGTVLELSLSGNSVTVTNPAALNGEISLAFCNNLNGGSYSPTFYSQKNFGSYFTGTSWQNVGLANYINYGGGGNHLYLHNPGAGTVTHYNGSQFNIVYTNTQKGLAVADLAVDGQGNVIFVTGSNLVSDSLFVVSPSGQKIRQIPITIPYYHAYGSFYMNGIYYVGYGSTSPTYPDKILPISIGVNSVTIGNPIQMPVGYFFDLANCESMVTGIKDEEKKPFMLFPDPVIAELNLQFEVSADRVISLYNTNGQLCLRTETSERESQIVLDDQAPGMYILQITERANSQVFRRKLIIQ